MTRRPGWIVGFLVGLMLIPRSGLAARIHPRRVPVLFQIERSARYPFPVASKIDRHPASRLRTWLVSPGSLQQELRRWSARSGYQLVWKSPQDYLLTTHAILHGTFIQALDVLVQALQRAGSPVRATLYRENRVLIIRRSGGGGVR
jgi:hypothetical protein